MATPIPVDIRELKKIGELKKSKFFEGLSAQDNYVAPEVAKDFYMGFVRHITKELRDKGVVILPELGYFALVKQKPSLRWAGKVQMFLAGKYALRFYAHEPWREYFTKLGEKGGMAASLDPRERLLGKKL